VKNSMGMVKQFLMEYCEALYPNDVEAQDELFKKIVDGAETPSMEEMRYIVDDFRMKKLTPFSSFAAAEEARDEAIEGDFSILINASLRSLPGFTDLHRRGHNGLG
jgi:hypothetical protein